MEKRIESEVLEDAIQMPKQNENETQTRRKPRCKSPLTLPRSPLNQPQVKPTSILQLVDKTSSTRVFAGSRTGSSMPGTPMKSYPSSIASSQMDNILDNLDEELAEAFSEMFSTNLRKWRNRNRFVTKVFFILGLQICFSFLIFVLFVLQEKVEARFYDHVIVLIVVTTVVINIFVLMMFMCSTWFRYSPNNLITLVIMTVSVSFQLTAFSALASASVLFMYITGSMMTACFIVALLATSRRWDISTFKMILTCVITSGVVSAFVIAILTVATVQKLKWDRVVIATVLTLVLITFLMLVIKNVMDEEDLKISEFIYAALRLYLSISTLYIIKTLILCFRGDTQTDD